MTHEIPIPPTEAARQRYERWLAATHRPAHGRRTAEREAAFVLPYLRPGTALLDAGCGPGSITLGLAAAVAPGNVTGIDINPANIEHATEVAAAQRVTNARFELGDIYELHFEDASFDAVFVHAVLQHLSGPAKAVAELYRVVRPGGLIALADADLGSVLIHPNSEGLRRWVRLGIELREHGGGSPHAGSRLGEYLAATGCTRITMGATARAPATAEEAKRAASWNAAYVAAPEYADYVTGSGLATREELALIGSAWTRWGASPGAFMATFWCHAIGWKD